MKIGQKGDTRKYHRLKKTDYYAAKSAVEAEKRQPKSYRRCTTCGDVLDDKRAQFGSNEEPYCHRCWSEKSSS